MKAVAPDHRIRRATMDDVVAILASSTFRIADMLERCLLRRRAIQGLESESELRRDQVSDGSLCFAVGTLCGGCCSSRRSNATW